MMSFVLLLLSLVPPSPSPVSDELMIDVKGCSLKLDVTDPESGTLYASRIIRESPTGNDDDVDFRINADNSGSGHLGAEWLLGLLSGKLLGAKRGDAGRPRRHQRRFQHG